MSSPISYLGLEGGVAKPESDHCPPPLPRTCHNFQVGDCPVCVAIYGIDGRGYKIYRTTYIKGCPTFREPYPCKDPIVLGACNGDDTLITKPGRYEVCEANGEVLTDDFYVEVIEMSEKMVQARLLQELLDR